MLYLRARYYDPATQQFLTVDPIVAQTEQAYAYAAGSPTYFTDPSGLQTSPDGFGQWIICMFGFCNPDPLTNPMAIPAQIGLQTYQAATNVVNAIGSALSGVGEACATVWRGIADRWQEAFGAAAGSIFTGKLTDTLARRLQGENGRINLEEWDAQIVQRQKMSEQDFTLSDPLEYQERLYVRLTDLATGDVTEWSVNYGRQSGEFGIIKPSSGRR